MKTYLTDIFERIKNYSKKLDDLALLTDKHWVLFDQNIKSKIVYIFQKSGVLLISVNGNITKSKWEYLGNNSSAGASVSLVPIAKAVTSVTLAPAK